MKKKTTLIFNKFFNDSIYLIPLRNPLRAYESIIKKVRAVTKLRGKEYYPSGQLVESALDIKDFYSLNMKMYFIKIEDLSKNLEYEMKKLAKFLKINFNDSMLQSTFGGYKYWSNNVDKRSNKFDISRHNYSVNLPRKDLIILNSINKQFLDILNYEKITLTNI